MGERTEVLRVDGQRVGEQESRELSTLTARIHSDRSSDERVLHSRRTLGLLHVLLLLATVADSRREKENANDGEEGRPSVSSGAAGW
jgi:hypothetical protein